MKCLILAAGKGSRLRQQAESKPLLPLLGIPLIVRTIRTACEAGADDFVVVTGHAGKRVDAELERLSNNLHCPIKTVQNTEWETTENGHSILAAETLLQDENFLLLMADHLFEPQIIRKLITEPVPDNGLSLAVDQQFNNPLVDLEDVTKVRCAEGWIQVIGKNLEVYDGYDTGIFLCTPALFDAIRTASKKGDTRLSAAVLELAQERRAKAVDVSGCFWIDVDDKAALERAEQALLHRLRGKVHDGPVSRWLNRPLSIRISRYLAKTGVTPNQISFFSFLLSVIGALLFSLGSYPSLLLGGLLAQLASIIDGCDGEIARLKYQSSAYGGWFDAVLDRYADAFLLFGMTWYTWLNTASALVFVIGFFALTGSFMVSYTADKYDGLMRSRGGSRFRIGRDVRVFLIFLGALFDQVLPVLVFIAVVMNMETLRRLWVCRK